jgi:hypothetical protein
MTSKLIRARESILQFIKTANPNLFVYGGIRNGPEIASDLDRLRGGGSFGRHKFD